MSNWKTNSKTSQLIGFLGFIVICVVFAFLFKNENARYFLTRETKVISKEDNSLEYFLVDNSLNKTFDKIKNKKYDEFDFVETALVAFHKVVIDKDESYAKYLDQKVDEEKLSSFKKGKEKEDNYMFIMLAYQLLYTNIAFIVYWFICNVIFDSMVLKYGSYSE